MSDDAYRRTAALLAIAACVSLGCGVGESSDRSGNDTRFRSTETEAAAADQAIDYQTAPYVIERLPINSNREAVFSPDGNTMLFADLDDGLLKTYDISSGQSSTLYTPPTGIKVERPCWTNNNRIFFHTYTDEDGSTPSTLRPLWVLNDSGSAVLVPYPDGLPTQPLGRYNVPIVKISPDGSTAAAMSWVYPDPGAKALVWEIWIMDVVFDNGAVALTNPRSIVSDIYSNEVKEFTSDSNKIVFVSTRGDLDSLNGDLFSYDLRDEIPDDQRIRRHTYSDTWEEQGDILYGDGRASDAMAFHSDRAYDCWYQRFEDAPWMSPALAPLALIPLSTTGTPHELFVAGPEGDAGWVRQLTFGYEEEGCSVWRPRWSSGGRKIAFEQVCPKGWLRRLGLNPPSDKLPEDVHELRTMLLTFGI